MPKKSAAKAVMKREEESGEPASKRRKLAGACAACGKKPTSDAAWGSYEVKANSSKVAVGDACASCMSVWTSAFTYLQWQEYADFAKTEETWAPWGIEGPLETKEQKRCLAGF